MNDAQLRTVWEQRQVRRQPQPLAPALQQFMKRTLGPRVRKLSQLAAIWDEVLPEQLRAHTALEGFANGVLTVLVDSAAHRFQIDTLLRGGLQREIQNRFSGALRKIRLVPGQFYTIDETGQARYEF